MHDKDIICALAAKPETAGQVSFGLLTPGKTCQKQDASENNMTATTIDSLRSI